MDDDVIDEIYDRDITVPVDDEWATSENSNASAIVFAPIELALLV